MCVPILLWTVIAFIKYSDQPDSALFAGTIGLIYILLIFKRPPNWTDRFYFATLRDLFYKVFKHTANIYTAGFLKYDVMNIHQELTAIREIIQPPNAS